MITEQSQAARDRIRAPTERCGKNHPLNVRCVACDALAVIRIERNRADTELVYKLEREAEATL